MPNYVIANTPNAKMIGYADDNIYSYMHSKSNMASKVTVHFKIDKLSNKSSWDFECVLQNSDTYW